MQQQVAQEQQPQPGVIEKIDLPIVGPAYTDASYALDCQTCKNMYLVTDETGKYSMALEPFPGLTIFGTANNANSVRGLFEAAGQAYAIIDNGFYTLSSVGVLTLKGTLNSSTGLVWCLANSSGGSPSQIFISDGTSHGSVYNISTGVVTPISDVNYLNSYTAAFLNGFAIVNRVNQNQFQTSAAEDFTNWTIVGNANLAATSSWRSSDNIVAIVTHKRELYVFTSKGAEVWVPSTNSFPFQARDDVLITQGLAAAKTAVSIDNTIYWLSQTEYGRGAAVYTWYDITQQKISDQAVEIAIQSYSKIDDAIGYAFFWNGQLFYVLVFPSADATWVYNAATKKWQQWTSLHTSLQNTGMIQGRHLSNCYVYAYGKNLVGDYQSGNIYYLDQNNYTDNGATIIRERACKHLFKMGKRGSFYGLEIFFEPGVGLQNGQGSNPQVMLQVSKDGGRSYGPEMWRSIGQVGQGLYRARWNSLGVARDWVFRIRLSDPVKFVILGASADVEVCDF